jgi:hypothetical protein
MISLVTVPGILIIGRWLLDCVLRKHFKNYVHINPFVAQLEERGTVMSQDILRSLVRSRAKGSDLLGLMV